VDLDSVSTGYQGRRKPSIGTDLDVHLKTSNFLSDAGVQVNPLDCCPFVRSFFYGQRCPLYFVSDLSIPLESLVHGSKYNHHSVVTMAATVQVSISFERFWVKLKSASYLLR
jgi:hypothetical protein